MEVILIHGYLGFPDNCWFLWVRAELVKRGYKVTAPALPNPALPKKKEWVETIKKAVHDPAETILVGHSLGCLGILYYLQEYTGGQFSNCVLVSGFGRDFLFHNRLTDWFEQPLNFSDVKRKSARWTCIHSTNDLLVPFKEGEWLANQLNAELVIESKGHLTKREGAGELPSVLKAIQATDVL